MNVSRDDCDFSSLELLKRLSEEKQKQITDGKLRAIKDKKLANTETPFNIPKHWTWARLRDISIIQEGPGIRKYQYTDEGIQFLTVTNILEGSVDLKKSQKYVSFEEYDKKYRHFELNKNDVVIACSGGSWGKSAVYEHDDKVILNTSTLRLRFFGDIGDNKFLYYITKSGFFNKQIERQLSGQQPNFGYSHYSVVYVPLPPVKEQKIIVAKLDQAFSDIEKSKVNAEKNLKNAKELFESYLQGVFSHSQEGWAESNLQNITSKIGSGATPRGGKAAYKEHGMSLIRSMNVHDRRFKEKNLALIDDEQAGKLNNVTLEKDDVLLNITGASVARCCVVPDEYLPARVNQHVSIIRVDKDIISPRFLCFLLTSSYYKNILLEVGGAGATREAITKVQLQNFIITYPDTIKKQDDFLDELVGIESKSLELQNIYTQKIKALDELKQSILQKAFNGELA
jgi:type I restriction enzyme S subunit